jgi:MFS family permease
MTNKNNLFTLMTLFMVIMLDIMGIILVFPVLTPLIIQPSTSILPLETSVAIRDFTYGLVMAIFPFFMFFSTPILGDLSDKFGRKKILLICLIGSAVSYWVAAAGIMANSLLLLMAGRALSGLAAGTQPIASAAIVDVSTPETKTRNLSWIVLACSVGLIIGPLIGGATAEISFFNGVGYQTPFILAGILCLANAVFLHFTYQETMVIKPEQQVHFTKGFRLFLSAFSDKKFRVISVIFCAYLLAWSLYFQWISWYFVQKFQYNPGKLGFFNGYMGVVFAVAILVIGRFVLKSFSSVTNLTFFMFFMAIANVGAGLMPGEMPQWLWVILNATSDSICYSAALALFTGMVDEKSQGWMMGVIGAFNAVMWTLGGIIIGPMGYANIYLPVWSAAFLCFGSFILLMIYRKSPVTAIAQ